MHLFSEIIGIWLISTWYTLDRPKNFNIVELGPGDGSLTKILLKTFKSCLGYLLSSKFTCLKYAKIPLLSHFAHVSVVFGITYLAKCEKNGSWTYIRHWQ